MGQSPGKVPNIDPLVVSSLWSYKGVTFWRDRYDIANEIRSPKPWCPGSLLQLYHFVDDCPLVSSVPRLSVLSPLLTLPIALHKSPLLPESGVTLHQVKALHGPPCSPSLLWSCM